MNALNRLGILWLIAIASTAGIASAQSIRETDAEAARERAAFRRDDPAARDAYEWLRLRDPATGMLPVRMEEKERAFAATLPKRIVQAHNDRSFGATTQAVPTSWSSRGPRNVGGRTRALAISVSDESVVLAGGVSGAMHRSNDGGSMWTVVTDPQDLHCISCIAQDRRPGHTGTWFYGTGEYRGSSADGGSASYHGNGIYKSTDEGRSWYVLPSTATNTPQENIGAFDYVFNIAVDPFATGQSVVYAAVIGAIYRSIDAGTTWTRVLGKNQGSQYSDVTITAGGVLYATLDNGGADRGFWRSVDGLRWTRITPTGWPASYDLVVTGIAPSNPNIVYFYGSTPGSGTHNVSLWKYTYLSGNGAGSGGTWEDRSSGLPTDIQTYSSYCQVIAVKPDDPETVFLGAMDLYRSTDGFKTTDNWVALTGVTLHLDQHALAFQPSDPQTLYAGCDGGVFATAGAGDPFVSWTPMNAGYQTTQFYTCAVNHATVDDVVIGGLQDNGTVFTNTSDAASPWSTPWWGDGSYCAITDAGSTQYMSSQGADIYRIKLADDGSVIAYAKVTPQGGTGYLFINPFALDPVDQRKMYLPAGNTLWRNSNMSVLPDGVDQNVTTNWMPLTHAVVPGATITAIGVSHVPAHRVYYGTGGGQVYRLDNADTLDPVPADLSTGKGLPMAYVSCIAIDPTNADNILLVFSNYNVPSLYFSSNGGESWTRVGGNLEADPSGNGDGPSCRWATILPVAGGYVYLVGTSVGLFATSALNGDNTIWTQEGPQVIGNVIVDMLDSRTTDGLVAAATHGAGMFSAHFSEPIAPSPALIAPRNGALLVPPDTTLFWRAVPGAESYRMQVARDAGFSTIVAEGAAVSGTQLTLHGLPASTKLFWRVEANEGPSAALFSATWAFTTGAASGISNALSSPNDFTIERITPNPVESHATVAFMVASSTIVTLDIVDALGRTVSQEHLDRLDEGRHEVALPIGGLIPGAYFCRLSSAAGVAVQAFCVVK